jgi:hypothetical protein
MKAHPNGLDLQKGINRWINEAKQAKSIIDTYEKEQKALYEKQKQEQKDKEEYRAYINSTSGYQPPVATTPTQKKPVTNTSNVTHYNPSNYTTATTSSSSSYTASGFGADGLNFNSITYYRVQSQAAPYIGKAITSPGNLLNQASNALSKGLNFIFN